MTVDRRHVPVDAFDDASDHDSSRLSALQWRRRSKGSGMSVGKRRAHARVEADIACIVDGTTEGRIRNLSVGGALLFGPVGFGDVDDTVSVEFPVGEAQPLTVFAEVLRITEHGIYAEYGLEFVAVEPVEREKIGRCLELVMSGKGVERRRGPRLYRRIELRCRTVEAFYATINNISCGGLGLECEVPLKVGEQVTVELLVGPLGSPLELTGIVKHVHPAEGGLHLVGLHFDPLAPGDRVRLDELIQSVLNER